LSEGHLKASLVVAAALVLALSGPLASATLWSSGIYGLGYGSFSSASMSVRSEDGVVKLGSYGIPTTPQVSKVPAVQLGSYGIQDVKAPETPGALQLSGYFQNRGSYTNMYFTPILGGTFGGSGGCSSCG